MSEFDWITEMLVVVNDRVQELQEKIRQLERERKRLRHKLRVNQRYAGMLIEATSGGVPSEGYSLNVDADHLALGWRKVEELLQTPGARREWLNIVRDSRGLTCGQIEDELQRRVAALPGRAKQQGSSLPLAPI